MVFNLLVPLFLIIPVFLTGTYVFARNIEKTVTRVFLFYSLAGTLIALTEYEMMISDNAGIASGWLRFNLALWPVLLIVQLHFLAEYTKMAFIKRTGIIYFLYAAVVLVSVDTFINKPFSDIVPARYGFMRNPVEVNAISEIVFAGSMTFLALLVTVIGVAFIKGQAIKKNEKAKALLVMAGLMVPAWMPFLKNALLPIFDIVFFIPDFPFVYAGWICFALAIWRYDMFEITAKTVADKIVSTMKEALMLVDEEGVIISVNAAFYRLFEFEGKGITGQSVHDFFKRSSDAEEKLGSSYTKGEVSNCTCLFDTKDKKGAHLNFSVSVLKNKKENIVGFVFIMSDISELAEAENRFLKQQENLVEIARQAGMAEIATNTMHNIGNILNSVNISSEHLISTLEKLKVKEFKQASDLILANSDSLHEFFSVDEKGKLLPDYLSFVIEELEGQYNTLKKERDRLAEKIRLIEENITLQQARAKQQTFENRAYI